MEYDYNEFRLKFASNEKEFIYNSGVNRGHSTSYSKINRCLFLSPEAKQLYSNISEYAYNGKRDCFPSQLALRLQLGWCRNTIRKFTYELRDAKFIVLERMGGGAYLYHITELHLIPMLAHSEFIHDVLEQYRNTHGEEVFKALEVYKQTSLCAAANENPVGKEDEIVAFFTAYFTGEQHLPVAEPVVPQAPEVTAAPTAIPGMPRRIAAAPVSGDDVQRVADPNRPERVKKPQAAGWAGTDVASWNTNHFVAYFESVYLEKMKLPMVGAGMKEKGQLKRLIDLYAEKKEILKQKIAIYVESDHFTPKGISNFCSNYVQGLLDQYLVTGSFGRKKESSLTPQEDTQETKDEFADLAARRRAQLLGGGN